MDFLARFVEENEIAAQVHAGDVKGQRDYAEDSSDDGKATFLPVKYATDCDEQILSPFPSCWIALSS